ncbi:MAG: hypothetical protein JXX28_08825 [Deltaproteobacteria bacterium]|nr:hypothetical protein [Deltaproteobacteria bacterium]
MLTRSIAASRPLWGPLGQMALLGLGVYLAGDRLDDLLVLIPPPWTPSAHLAREVALLLEGVGLLLLVTALLRPKPALEGTGRLSGGWFSAASALSLHGSTLLLAGGMLVVAGTWATAERLLLLAEDWTGAWIVSQPAALPGGVTLGVLGALVVGWRVGLPALAAMRQRLPRDGRWGARWWWTPPLALLALAAAELLARRVGLL